MDNFTFWLKDERKRRRISAKNLSEKIGKSHSYIHAVEKGLVKEIPDSVKQNIVTALGFENENVSKNQITNESYMRERFIDEVNSFLMELKTNELEGLVDIIHKRPELIWVLTSLMDGSKNSDLLYENLYIYSRYIRDLSNKNEFNKIINNS